MCTLTSLGLIESPQYIGQNKEDIADIEENNFEGGFDGSLNLTNPGYRFHKTVGLTRVSNDFISVDFTCFSDRFSITGFTCISD